MNENPVSVLNFTMSEMFSNLRPHLINWSLLTNRFLAGLLFASIALYALWPWLPWVRDVQTRTIMVYGFSILGEMMNDEVFPAFQERWERQTGERIEFISSFAASGTVTNQIILGVPAEVAILSLELDALRLVERGVLERPSWRELPHSGVLNRTPFIILVRQGNPRQITGFASLAEPGIGVVHPDPLTSGGAQWAILAEYGSALRMTGSETQAHDQLLGVWRNVTSQASSARAARTQFENGFGDSLITYEQEALWDLSQGRLNAGIVYPESTILSEHIVAVLDKNIADDNREMVEAFVAFLWSEEAQRIYVKYGFRSVDERLNSENPDFGYIRDPFTVADLGGWEQAKQEFIDQIWRDQILQEVHR
jgi:sulfate/thiosulfate transport system substrate-binding protein